MSSKNIMEIGEFAHNKQMVDFLKEFKNNPLQWVKRHIYGVKGFRPEVIG